METVKASFMWYENILTIFVEPTLDWAVDPVDATDSLVFLYRAVDENDQETGKIAGLQIIGFLEFEDWEGLPKLPMLWQIPGWEPLPLVDVLKREQGLLREKVGKQSHEQVRAS